MARLRRRSYRKFFRRKNKRNVWSKENLQFIKSFSSNYVNPPNGPNNPDGIVNPSYTMNIAVCSNGAINNAFNIASSSGIRTVKNFTISGSMVPFATIPVAGQNAQALATVQVVNEAISNSPIRWALIYCPQGMTQPYLGNADFLSLYEPNQNVIDCGVWQSHSGPLRIHSRMARKLHSGDSIYLCLMVDLPQPVKVLISDQGLPIDIQISGICSFVTKCN